MDRENFRAALLRWFDLGHRDLPWRRTLDPYRIWLSEIMLQQTRAAAAIPYYKEFLRRFPTVNALAQSSESEVLAAWSGLGYYSRARNLRRAAIAIQQLDGFPRDYDAIRALPGIGPYTAAAVASIAFDLPFAVLDGNVMRVIARLGNDGGDIAATTIRRRFQETADALLDRDHPGTFNQAMMELGATVCLPHHPMCLVCPVHPFCDAAQSGTQDLLPEKRRKPKPVREQVSLVIVSRRTGILMRPRPSSSSRMADFWELPGPNDLPGSVDVEFLGEFRHTIVNHCYSAKVYTGCMKRKVPRGMQWIAPERFREIPVSTMTRKAIMLWQR